MALDLDPDNLDQINSELKSYTPSEIIQWALAQGRKTILTTSFGPNAAVMLHLTSEVDPSVPVVWVDSGYNVRDTYIVAETLMQKLPLNMHIYTPEITAERRNALMGGIPMVDDEELHQEFTRQVKLEPFERALKELQPEIWLTGIRQEETNHRRTLDIVSLDARGIIKVAPIFYWSDEDVQTYMLQHELPSCAHYFDPTKVDENRECGLHTAA